MVSKLSGIELTRYDDLFKTDAEREADRQERIQIAPASEVFPYTLVNGQIYYRENSRMNPVEVAGRRTTARPSPPSSCLPRAPVTGPRRGLPSFITCLS